MKRLAAAIAALLLIAAPAWAQFQGPAAPYLSAGSGLGSGGSCSITIGTTTIACGGTATTVTALTLSDGTLSGTTTLPGSGSISSTGVVVFPNRLSVGPSAAGHSWAVDIRAPASGGISLVVADEAADATAKFGRIGVSHYTNSEEPVAMFLGQSSSSTSILYAGGGSGVLNAVTEIRFYTAANNTTVTGTIRGVINSSGNWGVGGNTNPQANLSIGTTAGTARTYNIFTDATSGEWAYLGSWGPTANVATFGTDKNGAGTTRNIQFYVGGVNKMDFGVTTASTWTLTGGATVTAALINTGITSDAAHTDSTVCQDTTTHQFYSGSGAAGICLGTSSLRFKHDVAPLAAGLDAIAKLEPIVYRYNKGYGDDGARPLYGFAAEQVQKVMPQLVGLDADGLPQSVDWAGVVPVLVNAVRELKAANDNLERRLRRVGG